MTRNQAHTAGYHAARMHEHAAVAWYTSGEQQENHFKMLEEEFRKVARTLGFIVTPVTVVTMEAAE